MKGYNSYLIFAVLISFGMSALAMDQSAGAQVRFRTPLNNGGTVDVTIIRPSVLDQAEQLVRGSARAVELQDRLIDRELKRRDAELRRLDSEAARKKIEAEREEIIAKKNLLEEKSDLSRKVKKNFITALYSGALGFIIHRCVATLEDPNKHAANKWASGLVALGALYSGIYRACEDALPNEFVLYTIGSMLAFDRFLK